MMKRNSPCWIRSAAYLGLGFLTVSLSGCLLVAAGAAAGGAATLGYFYYKGELCHNYNADACNASTAAKAALAELGMPVLSDEVHDGSGYIESRTNENERVHLSFRPESGLTQVGVRVGVFGDDQVSSQVLGRIEAHLTAPVGIAAPPPVPGLGPIRPVSASGVPSESPPPPLASEPPPLAAEPPPPPASGPVPIK